MSVSESPAGRARGIVAERYSPWRHSGWQPNSDSDWDSEAVMVYCGIQVQDDHYDSALRSYRNLQRPDSVTRGTEAPGLRPY